MMRPKVSGCYASIASLVERVQKMCYCVDLVALTVEQEWSGGIDEGSPGHFSVSD